MKFLITLAATISGPRTKVVPGVDFEWSGASLTHNVFRVFELIFGRKDGIRCESSFEFDENGKGVIYVYTFEAAVAHTESFIRSLLRVPEMPRIRIYIPLMAMPGGFPMPLSPFLFAIAIGGVASGNLSTTTPLVLSLTTSGSNRFLAVAAYIQSTTKTITGITYNAVALTKLFDGQSTNIYGSLSYLVNPATGANNISATMSAGGSNGAICGASYTGVAQTSTINTSNNANGSPEQCTSTVNNCWMIAAFVNSNPPTAGAGTTSRATMQFAGFLGDSNAPISPAGFNTMSANGFSGFAFTASMMIAPPATAVNSGFFMAAAR